MVRALATLILSVSTFEQAGIIDITQL
jgi:hypothetical protein